ncbi:HAMP domain-containing protein [Anaerosporobacter mobilis DSM 15930]|jgi:two-component system sensor histidine kinase YesM|uniref:HAMP domain-containing protein n=1 Tax=Anaerosporobacter mobilis DSM 15930 TaxID=1120996 RepID=A0A1M7NME3_9FIRM|nr:histidine kinase [Anaerosporobacter mobilis]SHN05102.1 HAMP domain-containing protein [Anaerosporobacter mobilis DSM 15930]
MQIDYEKENEKKQSLQWSMIRMLVLCWLLPLALLVFIMLFFMSTKLSGQTEDTIISSSDKAVEICLMQMEGARLASRNASYISTIRDSYYAYQKDQDKRKFYDTVNQFLAQQYKYNESFLSTMLVFLDDPSMVYSTYSNSKEATYTSVLEFKRIGLSKVLDKAVDIDTNIELLNIEGHLYMIRNLVKSNFEPYAVIVMEINTKSMFKSLKSIWGYQIGEIYMDGEPLLNSNIDNILSKDELTTVTDESNYHNRDSKDVVYRVSKLDQHKLAFVIQLDSNMIIGELDMVKYIGVIVLIFMIPLVMMVIIFFNRKVTKPIKSLVEAAHKITNKKYGFQVTKLSSSYEFDYLGNVFNEMSLELQYQFEQIYMEELALRDAKIKALQSQINPHFLNNTLEIINWEARLGGNQRVSGMIEALSTMLNATMNRKNQHVIPLEEELSYVDSYLYIIRQRFQGKIEVVKNIDEQLLTYEVPRLIIQPIVENAIEHGTSTLRQGKIIISIYEDMEDIVVDIEDNGTLTDQDIKKINQILNSEGVLGSETSLNLGIRNVNQRLRILYGERYGLTINTNQNNHTVSRIRIGKAVLHNNIIQ